MHTSSTEAKAYCDETLTASLAEEVVVLNNKSRQNHMGKKRYLNYPVKMKETFSR